MKNSKIIAVILPIFLCIIGCRSIDQRLQEVIEQTNIITFENHGYYNSKDGLTIVCGGDSLFLNEEILTTNKRISKNLKPLRCLNEKIFVGDQNAIDMMVFILNKKNSKTAKNIILNDAKFRGEALFEILLKLGNEIRCQNDNPEEVNTYSYWAYILDKMIRNINNLPTNVYQAKAFAKKNIYDNYSDDKCEEYLSLASYQVLTEAWEAGIVNLKDFGEE